MPHDRSRAGGATGRRSLNGDVMLNGPSAVAALAVDARVFRVANHLEARARQTDEVERKLLKFTPPEFTRNRRHWLILWAVRLYGPFAENTTSAMCSTTADTLAVQDEGRRTTLPLSLGRKGVQPLLSVRSTLVAKLCVAGRTAVVPNEHQRASSSSTARKRSSFDPCCRRKCLTHSRDPGGNSSSTAGQNSAWRALTPWKKRPSLMLRCTRNTTACCKTLKSFITTDWRPGGIFIINPGCISAFIWHYRNS